MIAKSINLAAGLLTWPKFSMTSFSMISALNKQGLRPATIIDVGANVGQFAIAAAKLLPGVQVHSFEPNPPSAAQLRHNVRNLKMIQVHELALGEQAGTVDFHVNAHSHSSSILPLANSHLDAFPEARESKVIQVPVSTLDVVFDGVNLPGPVLLKLDVQGYELPVLLGGKKLLERVELVLLEASFKPLYQGEPLFMDIVAQMRELGFEFLRPVGFLQSPQTGEFLQMDALFQRKDG